MKKLFLSTLSLLFVITLFAQDSTGVSQRRSRKSNKKQRIDNLIRMEEEGDLIFNKHNIFGIRLATDGYGINFEKGKFKTPTRTMLYQFELNEKKSNKEHRISGGDQLNYSSSVPYKLNNFYIFKLAVGEQRLIGGKGNKNGVAVTALYTGGFSLGMLKPYYVDVQAQGSNETIRKTFAELAKDTTVYLVTGASGFTVGWGHLSIKPGINAKGAMRFDYGRLNQSITAIEVGLTGEYFFSKIPQVEMVPQKNFFFNAYVQIMFGSRK